MKIFSHIYKSALFGLKSWGMLLILILGVSIHAQAQLVIGGNVYGGGDLAPVGGSTEVHVISGDVEGSLFGGARMANIGGSTIIHIDGAAQASEGKELVQNYILIDYVYGGNDISGSIGSMAAVNEQDKFNALTAENGIFSDAEEDNVDASWNVFLHISDGGTDSQTGKSKRPIYIGQLFGGGNGDYDYSTTTSPYYGKSSPEIDRTYLDIHGGSIVYAYGGGNNATVRKQNMICYENPSAVVNSILDTRLLNDPIIKTIKKTHDEVDDTPLGELLTFERFKNKMGINTGYSSPSSDEFQVGRMFGGNNKAEMYIRPEWHLEEGKIRNLYSGGNQGIMTNSEGLLLVIDPKKELVIDNVYGGCRMANVRPLQFNSDGTHVIKDGNVVDVDIIQLTNDPYNFPVGLSARVLVKGGDINNVYGGNDVTGQVYGGNAVGINTSIRGSVYGGGNGSYPYTDNPALIGHDIYGDLHYPIPTGKTSIQALSDYRPDAEQVSIHLTGTADKPTIIGGSVYCGGNSATLDRPEGKAASGDPLIELKVGSYVYADKVFMGNNGENMIKEDLLKIYAGSVDPDNGKVSTKDDAIDFSSLDLKDPSTFAQYMNGMAMKYIPTVTFDSPQNSNYTYYPYTAYFGSFYCGGNVGSMMYPGTNTMDMDAQFVIFNKFVGGCNNANVPQTQYNAYYEGGILGSEAEQASYTDNNGKIKDRLVLNFNGPIIEPKRWNATKTGLEWNTIKNVLDENDNTIPIDYQDHSWYEMDALASDANRRLEGGNVYGGCYNSGLVNGNVVININSSLIQKENVFAQADEDEDGNSIIAKDDEENYINYNSGVILDEQAFDVMFVSMSVFGGGYGKNTEIWGSTTINVNNGYAVQAFGGGHAGVIGKGVNGSINLETGLPQKTYAYNQAYSTTVNLNGQYAGYSKEDDGPAIPELEYIYGAGNEGDVCGNAIVNLGNGRIYDAFGGASDAKIYGHTEVYIGRQPDKNNAGEYVLGFPWIRDIVYGGNDFGGTIEGTKNYADRVSSFAKPKVHGYNSTTQNADVLTSNAYVEYLQGRVDTIFGGCYGFYDYSDTETYGVVEMPTLASTFVNIRPENHPNNSITGIFGGSTGYPNYRNGDKTQDRSYVLIDIPQDMENFRTTEIFGAGSYNGLGMKYTYTQTVENNFNLDNASAIIDLMRGQVGAAYGASYNQGVTRRTVVNVPQGSTINIGSIFGGGYGTNVLSPCDVYESHVNYRSSDALMLSNSKINPVLKGIIYGGNNSKRRTVFANVNISADVKQKRWGWDDDNGTYNYLDGNGTVYGAGLGPETWANYTLVNLEDGAIVYEVYGGGQKGTVINNETTITRMTTTDTDLKYGSKPANMSNDDWDAYWEDAWKLSDNGYDPDEIEGLTTHPATSLNNEDNPLIRVAEMDDRTSPTYRYNTNVIINEGATVTNYAYGGGYGEDAVVSGTTYIALLGGTVKKDIYAAGTSGAVLDLHNSGDFTASANVYIKGGTVRNVYGGGWRGSVGYANYIKGDEIYNKDGEVIYKYTPDFTDNQGNYTDILGETHVVIGDKPATGQTYTSGIPSITRNVYGGGEGGAIYGTAYLTINNGWIGYRYNSTTGEYDPELTDTETNDLEEHGGNAFGGGYVGNSYVDNTYIKMFGGTIRGDLFGGGEIAPVGRGTLLTAQTAQAKALSLPSASKYIENQDAKIFKAGRTHIEMYNGNVLRSVFGGGRGYDNWRGEGWMTEGEEATMDLSSKGYVFGQTDVNIYGGEIGTEKGVALGHGNVFGGGDEGLVYSAYMQNGKLHIGKKPDGSKRFDDHEEGYYYEYNGTDFVDNTDHPTADKVMTEDCHVLIEPWLQVTAAAGENGILYDSKTYHEGDYIPTDYLNTLPKKQKVNVENTTQWVWQGDWDKVDAGTTLQDKVTERGIKIHNAVFAGGNTASGGSLNVNATTVFGNATASINDVYHRDLITIGTGHTGGLYGDGNLTFVDGYREINITNYGTDYFNIDPEITIDILNTKLAPREQAYYEIRYKCVKDCVDKEGTQYRKEDVDRKASTITADQLVALFVKQNGENYESVMDGNTPIMTYNSEKGKWEPSSTYWVENGVCSRYAGRIMNTIQRADFCGVFGSRMVMQGAQDRVPETVDYTNYTINRVREVSLNKKLSVRDADHEKYESGDHAGEYKDENAHMHGNYFGIYSVVNYLGALTSDVDFNEAVRVSDNKDYETYRKPITMKVGETTQTYNYGTENATYHNWKQAHYRDNTRNNGNSHNQVALASGVYLELVTEKSTGTEFEQKDWGLITGVVELDLINVATGIGGGFVYARNEHGVRTKDASNKQITLSSLNNDAVSNKMFTYAKADADRHGWQTSGNFVHSTQTIIDDCYNIGGRYLSTNGVPAHYWFIKGQVYIYDQYISAYTGSSNAYSEKVDLPLTLTAASHGEMKLLDVEKNRYAYYSSTGSSKTKLNPDQKLIINEKTYYLNDPINYWDWNLLSTSEQELFVEETYTNAVAVSINGGTLQKAGSIVMLPADYNGLASTNVYTDANGEVIRDADKNIAGKDYIFRLSNNMDHDGGYILTYQVNNPALWDQWYSPELIANGAKKSTEEYGKLSDQNKAGYIDGPTYKPLANGIYGQRSYQLSDIIDNGIETTYRTALQSTSAPANQATFERAYITTAAVDAFMNDPENPGQTKEMHLNERAKLAKSEYSDNEWTTKLADNVALANICKNTIKISNSQYILANSLITDAEKSGYITGVNTDIDGILNGTSFTTERKAQIKEGHELTPAEETALGEDKTNLLKSLLSLRNDIESYVVPAWYCTKEGLYGGDYYVTTKNYRALNAWSAMSESDRSKFQFNYDALDLLIDPNYSRASGEKYQYDGAGFITDTEARTNPAGYSLPISLDYTATFTGSYTNESGAETTLEKVEYSYGSTTVTIKPDDELTPQQYEAIPNEKRHYSRFNVSEGNETDGYKAYIVNTAFVDRDAPFAVGQAISGDDYNKLKTEDQGKVTVFDFGNTKPTEPYYYCREPYTIGKNGDIVYNGNVGKTVTAAITSTGVNSAKENVEITVGDQITNGNEVPKGFVINKSTYGDLTNLQLGFTIHGIAPKEYSTLYVSRNSDIRDLSSERIITVVYQYDYEESNESGSNITAMSERHVVNIHIQFKSGIPTIDDITKPATILPGSSLTLNTPTVSPGAYEILGSGWELFEKESYAELHTNGKEYVPMNDELFWYQDGYYLAYYAKTYLGKTYSNHVPVSVANYHDLKKVMDDNVHHMYVDYDRSQLKRDSKIYINDYTGGKNGVELLKDFYDLSLENRTYDQEGQLQPIASGDLAGQYPMNSGVRGGNNIQFILRTDIDNTGSEWTPIGQGQSVCFSGTLHGDGYTIKGLTNSLFSNLCGNVYNLGVTGSFTGAGIAETGIGYVENSWISTTSDEAKTSLPIIGAPSRTTNNYDGGSLIQVVNSYYMEDYDDAYSGNATPKTGSYTKLIADREASDNYVDNGTPIRKDAQAFYNGEVAYNLNGFYLNKRYYDGNGQDNGLQYYYLTRNADGTVADNPSQAYYPTSYAVYPIIGESKYGYVENRYADGDYRYAAGIVPTWTDSRERTVTDANSASQLIYAPIWPTDYLYFGQTLTYGYELTNTHQDNPSRFNGSTNRVFRAPAYFGDSNMDIAHYNANAVLPATAKDNDDKVYPGMTAIDFTGYGDNLRTDGASQSRYFYPILDFDGLTGLRTDGQTQNLLAYSDATDDATTTVICNYFKEPDYFKYANTPESSYNTANEYNSIRQVADEDMVNIHGHHVVLTTVGNNTVYQAVNDQFLVDKQDFNAPISYNMGDDHVMWYQRAPEVFVQDAGTGWEGISLPFTVKTVTTSQKGWITHFYEGSNVGHEYWLRIPDKLDETDNSKVLFKSIPKVTDDEADAGIIGTDLAYNNYFLWDYYYNNKNNGNGKGHKDKNDDTYQTYYSPDNNITHANYPFGKAAQPYLIGFPGSRYYEFDMSGTFLATTAAANTPAKLDAQIITFVSAEGIGIEVSDIDYETVTTIQGYQFTPTYQAHSLDGQTTWLLDADGTKFQNKDDNTVTTVAFRPYFKASGNQASRRGGTRGSAKSSALYIGYIEDQMPLDDVVAARGLYIYGKDMSIWVESTLEIPATVTVTTVGGRSLGKFTIQPGTRIQIPVNNRGIYIVNKQKVAVTK